MILNDRKPMLLVKTSCCLPLFLLLLNSYNIPIMISIRIIYNPRTCNTIVIKRGECIKSGTHRHLLLLCEWIKPYVCNINLVFLISISKVLVEQCLSLIVSITFIFCIEFTLGISLWTFVIDRDQICDLELEPSLFWLCSLFKIPFLNLSIMSRLKNNIWDISLIPWF